MQIDSEDSENKGTYSTAFNMAKQCDRCYNYIYIYIYTHTHTVTYTLEYPWRLFPPWKDYSAVSLVLNIKISESFKI